eukprot:GHVO01064687.1.p1 GENE.GHVO01064687.1~~GHVO01064687.1.p1  ORF type:complete len:168 (+),score=49.48 GHVO01064687.1:120-623(+)
MTCMIQCVWDMTCLEGGRGTRKTEYEGAPVLKIKKTDKKGKEPVDVPKEKKSKKRKAESDPPSTADDPVGSDEAPKKKHKSHEAQLPFRRIESEIWKTKVKDARLLDNSYESMGGDKYAEKAAESLKRVVGKDFRAEKAKKKRATWKGCGSIDMGVNSVKFSDSEDE